MTRYPEGLESDQHVRARMDEQHLSSFLGKRARERTNPQLTTQPFGVSCAS